MNQYRKINLSNYYQNHSSSKVLFKSQWSATCVAQGPTLLVNGHGHNHKGNPSTTAVKLKFSDILALAQSGEQIQAFLKLGKSCGYATDTLNHPTPQVHYILTCCTRVDCQKSLNLRVNVQYLCGDRKKSSDLLHSTVYILGE